MNDKAFLESKIRKSIKKFLGDQYYTVHEASRFEILVKIVTGILNGKCSSIRGIALNYMDDIQYDSKIKKIKRWLQNKYVSYKMFYQSFIECIIKELSKQGELTFVIDGSTLGNGCIVLMFSVIYESKALPVVWKTYKGKKGHLPEKAHQSLLSSLLKLVPPNVKVTILGDGEFDGTDWQVDILNAKWDHVLRTGKQMQIEEYESEIIKIGWIKIEEGQSLFLENISFSQKKIETNLLVWHEKGNENPIYLITNKDCNNDIQKFYKDRFKIEPFFRDQKSMGFHIHKCGLSDPDRIDRLLIATCMAYILLVLAGVKALKSKFYDRIARTEKLYLSLFQIGYRFINYLVDIRQWRTFSLSIDLNLYSIRIRDDKICVPF